MNRTSSVLRWGGLTSIGGGLLFILIFAWVIILAGPDPDGLAAPITRFPEIKAVRTVENGLYLAALVLWVPVYLALYRRLERTRPAPALVGSALGTLGLGVLAAGAIPHAATSRLSDLYHAAGTSAEDQATLVLVWQGTQGIFDALLLAGLLVTATGIVLLGLAMLADPAFGKAARVAQPAARHRRARRRHSGTHRSQVVAGRAWHLRPHRLPPHPRVEGLPTVQSGFARPRSKGRTGRREPCLVGPAEG